MSNPTDRRLAVYLSLATVRGGEAAGASALDGACCASTGRAQRSAPAAVARLIPGPLTRRGWLGAARPPGRAMRRMDKGRRRQCRAPPRRFPRSKCWSAPVEALMGFTVREGHVTRPEEATGKQTP